MPSNLVSRDENVRRMVADIESLQRKIKYVLAQGGSLTFQPRIRCWIDRQSDIHLAGEPEGFQLVVQAARVALRGHRWAPTIPLVRSPIPKGRNPVTTRCVRTFAGLNVRLDDRLSGLEEGIEVIAAGDNMKICCGDTGLRDFYVCGCEAADGEGDYGLACRLRLGKKRYRDKSIWFWGFRNIHRANSF